jgi:hypothetical protein
VSRLPATPLQLDPPAYALAQLGHHPPADLRPAGTSPGACAPPSSVRVAAGRPNSMRRRHVLRRPVRAARSQHRLIAPAKVPSGLGARPQLCPLSRCVWRSTRHGHTIRAQSRPHSPEAQSRGASTATMRPPRITRSTMARPSRTLGTGRSSVRRAPGPWRCAADTPRERDGGEAGPPHPRADRARTHFPRIEVGERRQD